MATTNTDRHDPVGRALDGTILVTGGAGYIGSHTTLLLLDNHYHVVVIDNCPQSSRNSTDSKRLLPESLLRVEELSEGKQIDGFYNLNLVQDQATSNEINLDYIFQKHNVKAVIHFAALKSVSESIEMPLEYYTNNLIGTINLLNAMQRNSCHKLIFSSSATVYGLPEYNPVDELHRVGIGLLNPYGKTKYMIEEILKDLCSKKASVDDPVTRSSWNIIALRYFNPVGAHPSGYIGEHTIDTPSNLMPYISQVAIGKREKLFIFGNDFDTIDGTGVRDYIHIMDLAAGHLSALKNLFAQMPVGQQRDTIRFYNIGTGRGYSVLETIRMFETINKVQVPYEFAQRRNGDAGEVFANADLAKKELGWSAKYSLTEMVRDTYKWQSKNIDGYDTILTEDQRREFMNSKNKSTTS